ncbi:MAG: hypothetical protein II951_06535 [Bacteroidales bacterium]|nr:hypothetical protein [Bacteroidales bacterium]
MENTKKYKVLWIDDEHGQTTQFDNFKKLAMLQGIEFVTCRFAKEGMELFDKHIEEWSGVVLDAKSLRETDNETANTGALMYSLLHIAEMSSKRYVPKYIFTGQPDLQKNETFGDMVGSFYVKGTDNVRLINDIEKNAEELWNTQLRNKYRNIFDDFGEEHDVVLLRIAGAIESEETRDTSVLNDCRKILENAVLKRFEDAGLLYKREGMASDCSAIEDLNEMDRTMVPAYVPQSLNLVRKLGNEFSHLDADVRHGKAPYVIRCVCLGLMTLLDWAGTLPTDEQSRNVKRGIIAAMRRKRAEQAAEDMEKRDAREEKAMSGRKDREKKEKKEEKGRKDKKRDNRK